ncbi:MAG: AIR synthase-related protein, partial [Betaproteobacteria bacterium]
FGLLGHLLEVCRASNVGAVVDFARIPLLPATLELARAGLVTGASGRNFAGYGDAVDFGAGDSTLVRAILTDPQTSGGLLVACAPAHADAVVATFRAEGFAEAAVIGECVAGPPRVAVR